MVDGLLRLLSLSLSGALLTGGTALLARLLRGRISRTAAYYLWLPVLMRLLCPGALPHPDGPGGLLRCGGGDSGFRISCAGGRRG
ncbi:MAG: hypothetical protein ACLT3D_11250 [Lawsonibacter sp.]